MSNRLTYIIAGVLLLIMLGAAFLSIKDDTLTFDETAHIAAGYSYLTQQDYRLNPEHPPLAKELAAFPLLFLDLNFPEDHASWTQEVSPHWWDQFNFASQFLYYSGNNPDQILFWSRMPMIFLLIFLGWFLFFWVRKLAGNKTALLALTFFSFSPTFLAHGRLVTTDVAATLGAVLATYFWLKFLKNPNKKNIIFAGLIFGLALLFKFSLLLLIPFFGIITLIYAWFFTNNLRQILKYLGLAVLVGLIGLIVVIWPVYQCNISNYPLERQVRDTQAFLSDSALPKILTDSNIWMASQPLLRPFSQYLLGLLMATNRTATGNTTYFLGMVSASAWWYYFPIIYLLKVPLSFHLLSLMALFSAFYLIRRPFWLETRRRTKEWILNHFPEFSMIVFLTIYWLTSIGGNLNIGVRHILPTFPFIYILVSMGIANWAGKIKKLSLKKMAISFISILVGFYIISSLSIFPYYLSYFNQLAGGSKNGYKYAVDSNYDWGQDLKRLVKFTEENKIEKIYLDYFGGGNPEFYLKEKYLPWLGQTSSSEFPQGNYLAVSVTLLQGGMGNPASGFDQPTGYYRWLNDYEPVGRAGYSIFIYYIE